MSSTLQQQLAAIAATSTHQLDIKAQKAAHGKSLLFEPKIAASQDFNTIYQICHEGFQELCLLDPRFAAFAQNLFSEQSKTEDRTQMTKAQNEELNNVIESFLGLVGARLLLKPAIKAVEWLVRRFSIHEYNTEFAILTFLPYHGHPIFLTLLSIVPRKISPTYRFLYPYMTSYQNPPRQTVVYTATHTPAFFSALNQYVLKVTRSHHQSPALLSFWASVATQAVDAQLDETKSGRGNIQRQREEDLLLRILPVLNEALSLKNAPELKLGCYMIMTVMASKASLEDKVLNGMMEAIVSSWSLETLDGALVSVAILAQERQGAKLPKAVARGLLKLDRLADRFLALSRQCRIDRLAFGIVLSIIEKFGKSAFSDTKARLHVVETTLQAQIYDDSQISIIIKSLLLTIHRVDQAADVTAEQRDQLADLIIRLHQSETIGKAVTKVIEDEGMDVEDLEMRLKIVLRPAIESAKQETEDTEMEDSLPALPDASEDLISNLPTRSTEQSLLVAHDSKLFATLSEAFLGCVSSDEKLKNFSNTPLFADNDTLFLTFLARFWCESHPALARSAALRLATEHLSGLRDGVSDFQGLIPYVLNALSDKSAGVRKAAAELAAKLFSKTAQKGTKTSIWARDTIYGPTSDSTKWLSAEDASKVLSTAVVPTLEECIMDGSHIKQVLQSAVDERAHKHTGWPAHGPEFKSSLRTGVCSFLSSHAVNTPLLRVRLGLLSFLDGVGKSASAARVQIVLPAVEKWLSLPQSDASSICRLESLDLFEVDRSHLRAIGSRDAEGVQLLQKIIAGQFGSERSNIQEAAFERLRTIWPSLKVNIQEEAARSLLDLALDPSETVTAQSKRENALETLRAVDLPTQALVSFLDSVPTAVQLPENPPASKRRRTSKAEMARFDAIDTEDTTKAIEKLTLVLELVEGSSPEDHSELLHGLFQILGELQQYKIQTQSSLVYLQSLIITSLLAVVDKLKATSETIDQSAIRADLLVDCVRQNANPQVQNSALLLISSLATSVPDTVLHSVMPIFTFMSSSTLRQTDEYSAHVIDQTISRVIPPLAASLRKRKRDLVLGAAELLLSFTAAYEHIPLHRRLGLFGQLTKTMEPDDSLFAIVAMLLERYPTDKGVKRFTVDLMRLFDPATNLRASKRYLDLVEDALQPKRTISDALFTLSEKDPDQIQKAAVHLFESLADLLRDVQLHNRVLKSLKDNNETADAVRNVFTQLLERIIELSLRFKDHGIIRDACGRVLSSLLRLLPTPELVKSADNLLGHSNVEVRRTALRAVEAQAIEVKQNNVAARTALLEFLPRITSVIMDSDDPNLKLTAVACIDQISEKFGKKDTSAVALAAETVAGKQSLGSKEDRLRVMSLLCLTSIVEILRDDFIPLIPKVLPTAFAYLEESIAAESKLSLHNAVYALLCTILEYIPFMFSGSHLDSALQLSHKSAVAELNDEADESRQHFYLLVAQQVDAKEVFGAAERNWESAVQAGYPAPKEHLAALHRAIEIRPKSVVVKNAQQLFGFLIKAFDLRRTKLMSEASDDKKIEELVEEVAEVEQQINAVAITTVMKLNDATFRPFFVRLMEWAASGLPKKEARGRMLRATSLFVFLDTFYDKLKSIVTGYSSYMLDLAAEVLGKTSEKSAEYIHLLESTLSALSKSFEHDEDDFWTAPAHFSVISGPLLSLIPAFASHPIAESHIIPSLTGLAAAANSPDHHKALNSSILKYMRHDSASTRLVAIKTEQALTEALGEEWLGLLPEMLPFISELQEDDDEQVERETARWIKRIEEVLGESLEGMLQ